MRRLLKYFLGVTVLILVFLTAGNEKCCQKVALCILEGLATGIGHWFVLVIDKYVSRRPLSPSRLIKLLRRDVEMGICYGLVFGVIAELVGMLI